MALSEAETKAWENLFAAVAAWGASPTPAALETMASAARRASAAVTPPGSQPKREDLMRLVLTLRRLPSMPVAAREAMRLELVARAKAGAALLAEGRPPVPFWVN